MLKFLKDKKKDNKGAIKNIEKILQMFDERSLGEIPAATAVNKAKEIINRY